MIFTTVKSTKWMLDNYKLYGIINEIMDMNPLKFPVGMTKVDGDDLFVNRISGETKLFEDSLSEIHKKYIDVHVVLKGNEKYRAALEVVNPDEVANFDLDKDAGLQRLIEDEQEFILKENQCAIFFPGEWHRPMLAINEIEVIEKIVIKVNKALL